MKKFNSTNGAVCIAALLVLISFFPVCVSASETDKLYLIEMPQGVSHAVADVMDGVEACYRTMEYSDWYGVYSCAGYVKKYYMAVYGVDVMNLTDKGPPHPINLFTQVYIPQKGDIIFYASPPHQNNHSAIVKSFDGQRIILIEQNFKWVQAGGTYTRVNRTIPYSLYNNDYQIWRLVSENEWSNPFPWENNGIKSGGNDTVVSDLPPGDLPPGELPPGDAPPASGTQDIPPGGEAAYEAFVTVGKMSMEVNGVYMPIDAPALAEGGRVIMPVRWVGYALGLRPEDLHWDGASGTVTVYNGGDIIQFTLNSAFLYVNGQPRVMDVPASAKNGRTYLPVRFLAEALGVRFEWLGAIETVRFFK